MISDMSVKYTQIGLFTIIIACYSFIGHNEAISMGKGITEIYAVSISHAHTPEVIAPLTYMIHET